MSTNYKPTIGYWIIAILALLWNLFGGFQFLLSTIWKDKLVEMSTESQMTLFNSLPAWYNVVFGIAVIAGILACLLLLVRKKLALPLFGLSLVAVLVQMGYWLFGTSVIETLGFAEAATMPILVILVAIFLYLYSKKATKKKWLN